MNKKDFYILDEYPLFTIEQADLTVRDFYWCVCYEDEEVRVFDKAQNKMYSFEDGKKHYLKELVEKYPAKLEFCMPTKSYQYYMSKREYRPRYKIVESEEE